MCQDTALDLLSGCHIMVLIFVILMPQNILRESCYDFDEGGAYYIKYIVS